MSLKRQVKTMIVQFKILPVVQWKFQILYHLQLLRPDPEAGAEASHSKDQP